MQKLFRSYSGDAGLLTDLVRAEITFGDSGDTNANDVQALKNLHKCLERICKEQKIIILKIKNRFDLDPKIAKSEESCGFRNISISMILVDEYTMEHSVDGHICELQLQLKAMKDMIPLGHENYVKRRDMLAV